MYNAYERERERKNVCVIDKVIERKKEMKRREKN